MTKPEEKRGLPTERSKDSGFQCFVLLLHAHYTSQRFLLPIKNGAGLGRMLVAFPKPSMLVLMKNQHHLRPFSSPRHLQGRCLIGPHRSSKQEDLSQPSPSPNGVADRSSEETCVADLCRNHKLSETSAMCGVVCTSLHHVGKIGSGSKREPKRVSHAFQGSEKEFLNCDVVSFSSHCTS